MVLIVGCQCHSGGSGPVDKPAANASSPIIVNNFFGPTMGGPATIGSGSAAMPAGGQSHPLQPG